jgi:hypothetical protein
MMRMSNVTKNAVCIVWNIVSLSGGGLPYIDMLSGANPIDYIMRKLSKIVCNVRIFTLSLVFSNVRIAGVQVRNELARTPADFSNDRSLTAVPDGEAF